MIDGQVRPIARLCFFYDEFVQRMDKDVVSLIGMTVLANESRTQSYLQEPLRISELAMLLYLLARCQMKIQSSKRDPDLSPLADALDMIHRAEIASDDVLDRSLLKLAERLSVIYITNRV